MVARALPLPLAQLPNALTLGRLLLIPAFVALVLAAEGGHTWAGGVILGAAGATDQVDGWLARRWRVESDFGKVADPLADRVMIDAAVILLWIADRLPWPALVVILARDVLLVGGYKAVVPRGYDFSVSFLGKAATWVLYASLCFVLVTHRGTDWPLWLFWAGVGLALASGLLYGARAWREVRRRPGT
jgi:CDP-diacylglycerol--glycerol-3-phosphate 3-phosphatidyltransferase